MKDYNYDLICIAKELDNQLKETPRILEELTAHKQINEIMLFDYKDKALDLFITKHSVEILDRLFVYYTPIFDEIEKLGYTVKRNNNEVILTNHSPAGEELYDVIYLDSEDSITLQLYKLYDNFDEEDHAFMLLEAKRHGFQGVPSIRELITDAEKISDMYNELQLTAYNAYHKCKETKQ